MWEPSTLRHRRKVLGGGLFAARNGGHAARAIATYVAPTRSSPERMGIGPVHLLEGSDGVCLWRLEGLRGSRDDADPCSASNR